MYICTGQILTIKKTNIMKNSILKSAIKTLALVLSLSLSLTSCEKNNIAPTDTSIYGDVTYKVIGTDTNYKSIPKLIKFGYDDVIKDTVVVGDFNITIRVPASKSISGDLRKLVLTCETKEYSKFYVEYSQFIKMTNHQSFKIRANGTCPVLKRELLDYMQIIETSN